MNSRGCGCCELTPEERRRRLQLPEGYEELHQSLKDLRANNPGWSINKTRRSSPILLTPTQIGLQEESTS